MSLALSETFPLHLSPGLRRRLAALAELLGVPHLETDGDEVNPERIKEFLRKLTDVLKKVKPRADESPSKGAAELKKQTHWDALTTRQQLAVRDALIELLKAAREDCVALARRSRLVNMPALVAVFGFPFEDFVKALEGKRTLPNHNRCYKHLVTEQQYDYGDGVEPFFQVCCLTATLFRNLGLIKFTPLSTTFVEGDLKARPCRRARG